MHRLYGLYQGIRERPYGVIVTAILFATPIALCMLCLGIMVEAARPLATMIAIGYGIVLLSFAFPLIGRARGIQNDTRYLISLEHGLRRAGYEVQEFFTEEAAGSPSLQLLHLKILQFCRPEKTLELGTGQTTKLLSCYNRQNPSTFVLSIEQDERWFKHLSEQVSHSIIHRELARTDFCCEGTGRPIETRWYKDIRELRDHRFNYVLVDGPNLNNGDREGSSYSRAGILEYVPAILAASFIVVFDDAERFGEARTINAFQGILRACSIRFVRFSRHGAKSQVVFCSPDLAYMQSV